MSNNENGGENYRKPPKETQFRKGHSGNPKGRPKTPKKLTRDLLFEKLNNPLPIGENGRIQKLTGRRAMVRAGIEQGLKGKVNAIARVLRLARDTGREKPEVIFRIDGLFGPDD